MTVACLTLLARARRPAWPFEPARATVLVEAFPAAQLRTWGLPFDRYNGSDSAARQVRASILEGVRRRLMTNGFEALLVENADALDAVVCAFAGVAVTRARLARLPDGPFGAEGWIAVHAE